MQHVHLHVVHVECTAACQKVPDPHLLVDVNLHMQTDILRGRTTYHAFEMTTNNRQELVGRHPSL